MNYPEWESAIPERVRNEPVWQMTGYRKALYLYELAWQDCGLMLRDPRGKAITEQLIRSAGSICANIEEGHGRGYGKTQLVPVSGHRLRLREQRMVLARSLPHSP